MFTQFWTEIDSRKISTKQILVIKTINQEKIITEYTDNHKFRQLFRIPSKLQPYFGIYCSTEIKLKELQNVLHPLIKYETLHT